MKRKKSPPHNSFAKKNLGQNFLQCSQTRDRILEMAGNIESQKILEIGPGLGFLTSAILKEKAELTAIELDDRASDRLERDLAHKPNFHLIRGNFLEMDLDEIFGTDPYSVIANIPYNITNPILKKMLANTKNKPNFCLLMVQKEVAQKICNTKKRSILSISIEVFAEPSYGFTVGRDLFSPVPKVDSAILRLDTRPEPLIASEMERDFFTMVNAGFSQKRKKLHNFIGSFFGVESATLLGEVDGDRRAETLSIEEWIHMTKNLQKALK